ncbi:MauE/DoxX family redox-associated membrane protein [Nocardia sp. CDC153]|uniref:MauE/DoxX family redox-associated membrane protein n=1 Tax=Nocardia sp. CDC153 TaxID=3112167 RepID=UPI002DBF8B7E|nr:MauE/DoxX family redox-associated membrane protein [Nocardia sp. CDC153]MEC3957955.1 MauE/DoxX family redox-associated membrane protein [Nocardia sp. CDC153]
MAVDYVVWAARLVLAVVFGLSAWGKFADASGTRKAVGEFGIPLSWVPTVAWGLPTVEAAVAVTIVLPWTAAGAGLIAILLLGMFTGAVVRLLRHGKRPVCSCFGAASAAPVGRGTVIRNIALIALAGWTTVATLAEPHVPGVLPVDHAIAMGTAAAFAAVLVSLWGELRALRRRLDEQVLSTLGAEGLPPGAVAPEFEVLKTGGGRTGLDELLVPGKSLLLVFVHPGCEMCAALARELPRWQARSSDALTIAVLGNGDVAEHAKWGEEQGLGTIPVLVQQGNEAALRYRVRGTPSGVLINEQGRVAAPVARGAMAVRDLIVQARRVSKPANPQTNGAVL